MKKKRKETIKKKSFYFKDFNESELIYSETQPNKLQISLNKVVFVFFIFISLMLIFGIKITYLSLSGEFKDKIFFSETSKNILLKNRRDIVDRNGSIIATNVSLYDAGIRPKLLKDNEKDNFLIKLRLLNYDLNFNNIKKKIYLDKFFWLQKGLTPIEKDKLWLMGNKAFEFHQRISRIYPQKNLFSHIVGQTDDENFGISGVEKSFDEELNNKKKINKPLELTLDTSLQHLIRQELINAELYFNNIGSAAILMDVESGEILSLVSIPDFDLNQRVEINDDEYLNKITLGVYEFGSVFKTFVVAAGLENKIIKPDTVFNNLENSLRCDKYVIKEYDKLPKNLNTEEILIRSSNIGAVKIGQRVGIKNYKKFLNSLGLLNKINFQLSEIGSPLPFNWGKCKLATTSYGHGITTTPLQLATAYAILGNGGYKIKPTILKNSIIDMGKKEKIISNSTSDVINSILRKVVSQDEGTANFANIEDFEVAGKTGTAMKYNSNAKLNTFVSLFPASRPKYVLLVMLDEPKPAPSFVYKFPPSKKFPKGYDYKGETRNTSGWNTVVVAGKIIEKIGPILAINKLEASNN